jgi:predicted membrane protein
MNRITEEQNKPRSSRGAIIGILMIGVGFVLIANQFDLIPYRLHNILFTWQSLLIFLGVIFVTNRENRVAGYILMGVGGFFLLPQIMDVPWEYRRLFWPVMFIIAGVLIIFKGSGLIRTHRNIREADSADVLDSVNIFGGGDRQITTQNFQGGSIISIFGGGKYDLRQAKLGSNKVVIEMINIFGGSDLILPSDWNVKSEVTGIFGGFSDKRPVSEPDSGKTLIVKGVAIFGGGDIKSF